MHTAVQLSSKPSPNFTDVRRSRSMFLNGLVCPGSGRACKPPRIQIFPAPGGPWVTSFQGEATGLSLSVCCQDIEY